MNSGPIDKAMEDQIECWRMKAEELRTTVDHLQNPRARASFQRMAETYERLVADFSRRYGKMEPGNTGDPGDTDDDEVMLRARETG